MWLGEHHLREVSRRRFEGGRRFGNQAFRCNALAKGSVYAAMLPITSIHRLILVTLAFGLAVLAPVAQARLGESEQQAKARYGEPVEGLLGPNDKPLIPGSNELAYNFEGWRIRAAFVNGVTHKIEYVKIPDGGKVKPLTEGELQTLLDAEKGAFKWREQKPRTGHQELNKLKEMFDGRAWERSDHAEARLLLNLLLVVQSREAEKLEKELAKKAGKMATPVPQKVPKF